MGLVLDELTETDQNIIKDNEINVVYDPKLKNYVDMRSALTIDYRKDRYGSGFVILGGSSC
jgi:Fe-S cluster assembly iron-binding protein IscA